MRRLVGLQNKNSMMLRNLVALMSIIWGGQLTAAQHLATPVQPAAAEQVQRSTETKAITRFVMISITDRQLALVDNGQVVKKFPIAVGKQSTPSPSGDFTIINRTEDPTYYHKGTVIKPGKSNPLGSRWMGLSQKGYGIHGTNVPSSIGKAASHGCFRMAKKDVEELFKLVHVGDVVIIRSEHDELVAQVFSTEKNDKNDAGTSSTDVQVASTDAGQN